MSSRVASAVRVGAPTLVALAVGWFAHAAFSSLRRRRVKARRRAARGAAARPAASRPAATAAKGPPPKMVLVVNGELPMTKGKTGAQCAHAAVGACERAMRSAPSFVSAWVRVGQTKICLRGDSTRHLETLQVAAENAGLVTYLVEDAGRTQIAPGSKTVLAVGPAPGDRVDTITGSLKLL